ncbi:MAG: Arc family DNA-binding protein [Candidatus Ornithospirochaeta sp.]
MAEKKQVPLRISKELFDELSRWAEDDFRSLNGQIEFLLTDCVRKRRRRDFNKEDEGEV